MQKGSTEEKRIIIYQGEENRTKIRDTVEEEDFFYRSYEQAAGVIEKNWRLANDFFKRRDRSAGYMYDCSAVWNDSADILDYSNNIVVFNAGRGAGKTSTMLSFGMMLQNEKGTIGKVLKNMGVENTNFQILSCIDPTFMESGDSILKVIISRMFLNVKSKWQFYQKYDPENIQNDKKQKLMQLFQKCYKTIDCLKGKVEQQDIYEDLYRLSELGDSTNLKSELYKLVEEYLTYVSGRDLRRQFLVLQIDDVDLNENMAYEILEDLRKYFMLPNVMIMMAADLKQIRYILEKNLAKDYSILLKYDGSVNIKKCKSMVEQYLEKVFPVVSRIHLPRIDFNACTEESGVFLEYMAKTDEDGGAKSENILSYQDKWKGEIHGFQEQLLRLIYEKTGIILSKKPYLHEILPKEMRELTHFLEFMDTMEDVPEGYTWGDYLIYYNNRGNESLDYEKREKWNRMERAMEIRLENLRKFEDYFSEYWCPYNLTHKQQQAYEAIVKAPLENKSERIISEIKECCDSRHFSVETFFDTGTFAEIEFAFNQWMLKDELKGERLLLTVLSVYFTIYKNRIALRDFLNDVYLNSIETLYRECRYVKVCFGKNNLFDQIFEIDYEQFQNAIEPYQTEKSYANYKYLFMRQREKSYCFDVLGPFTSYMQEMRDASKLIWKEDRKSADGNVILYQSIFQVTLNSELQQKIQKQFEDEEYLTENDELISPSEIMRRIYSSMEEVINSLEYLDIDSNIASMAEREVFFDDIFITLAFVCNSQIAAYYFRQFKKKLSALIPEKLKADSKKVLETPLEMMPAINKVLEMTDMKPESWGINNIILSDKKIKELFDIWNEQLQSMEEIVQSIHSNIESVVSQEAAVAKETIQEKYKEFNDLAEKWKNAVEELNYKKSRKRKAANEAN